MKRLLLLLLAALALPTAVNAETWHLITKAYKGEFIAIPMASQEDCEKEGQEITNYKNWKGRVQVVNLAYYCIKGK